MGDVSTDAAATAPRIYFEDLEVGRVHELGSFSLTEAEMIAFAERFDPAPFHVDPELADGSFFGGIVASGLHTLSAAYRLVWDGLTSNVALVAGRRVTFQMKAPVRPGELISVRVSVTEVRDAKRPEHGIGVFSAEALHATGVVAMEATFEALVERRNAAPANAGE